MLLQHGDSHQGDIHQRTVIASGRDKLHFLQPRTRPVASLQLKKTAGNPAIRQVAKVQSQVSFFLLGLPRLLRLIFISHHFTPHWFLPVMNCDGTYSVKATVVSFPLTSNRSTDSESVLGL